MAILSKIRERSMFLIIIIGLALFAFVLDPSTLGDFFNSNKVNERLSTQLNNMTTHFAPKSKQK